MIHVFQRNVLDRICQFRSIKVGQAFCSLYTVYTVHKIQHTDCLTMQFDSLFSLKKKKTCHPMSVYSTPQKFIITMSQLCKTECIICKRFYRSKPLWKSLYQYLLQLMLDQFKPCVICLCAEHFILYVKHVPFGAFDIR